MRFAPCFLACVLLAGAALMPHAVGSEALPEPAAGHSEGVVQPHVRAELIAQTARPGQPFEVALHLHMDANWHTYWINPGDAGLATMIKWTLPAGWSAGPIRWPAPELHAMGPLTTYGYAGDVYLLSTVTPTTQEGGRYDIKAHATWLVCQEECIPGKADLSVEVTPGSPQSRETAFFEAAKERIPTADGRLQVEASYGPKADSSSVIGPSSLNVTFHEGTPRSAAAPSSVRFFPEQGNVLGNDLNSQGKLHPSRSEGSLAFSIQLAQNGEKPDHLSGVAVFDRPIVGEVRTIYLPRFPIRASPAVGAVPTAAGASSAVSSLAGGAASRMSEASSSSLPSPPAHTRTLLAVLGLALLGGLVLNLMPCVLPVLSLKVFSLIRHAGEGGAWKQGAAFTSGVVVSFWLLAGLLIALESAGSHLGWGFQMQSPGFVLGLTFLFFLLGLNLFGVFELGTSLVGLDAKASSHLGGLASSFANGALATLAATPCTAPFMGSAVGFAAQQSAAISLLVFTFLALGMAAPYLALTIFPGALRLVPKPGAWMEALRQFMGFLLMGTVIFLVYVFGALVGQDSVPSLLGALLVAALAAWIFGRGSSPILPMARRMLSMIVALVLLAASLAVGASLTRHVAKTIVTDGWQSYSVAGVQQALKAGHPAFVDFTAAWCLSCKVNERVALDIDSTQKSFTDKHVVLFRGDWTHSDPVISQTLRSFNRDGVPLYLLYSPREPATPQVLPEVLTPGIVQDALQKLP